MLRLGADAAFAARENNKIWQSAQTQPSRPAIRYAEAAGSRCDKKFEFEVMSTGHMLKREPQAEPTTYLRSLDALQNGNLNGTKEFFFGKTNRRSHLESVRVSQNDPKRTGERTGEVV